MSPICGYVTARCRIATGAVGQTRRGRVAAGRTIPAMTGHVIAPAAALADQLPSWVTLLRAPNPGPMTLDGTNTWLLRAPGQETGVVIDPGPLDEGHLARIAAHGPIGFILITHGHPDHVEGAGRLSDLLGGVRVLAADPAHCVGADPLDPTESFDGYGLRVRRAGHPGTHRGLGLLPGRAHRPDRRRGARGGLHRGHHPRPGHHRGRPSGRRPRRIPGQPGTAHRVRRAAGAARTRPGAGRLRRRGPVLPGPSARPTRPGPAGGRGRRDHRPRGGGRRLRRRGPVALVGRRMVGPGPTRLSRQRSGPIPNRESGPGAGGLDLP